MVSLQSILTGQTWVSIGKLKAWIECSKLVFKLISSFYIREGAGTRLVLSYYSTICQSTVIQDTTALGGRSYLRVWNETKILLSYYSDFPC